MIRPYRGVVPRIADSAFIDPSAVVIGDVEIGARSSVWPNVSIRGDVNYIRVGDETSIQDNTVLHVDHRVFRAWLGTASRSVTAWCCMAARSRMKRSSASARLC